VRRRLAKDEHAMRKPPQYEAAEFLPRFFGLLFGPDDRVVVSELLPRTKPPHGWEDNSLPHPRAVESALRLCELDVPNVYFRASAHDGSAGYGVAQCVRIRALFLDVDYGQSGHKKGTPFKTEDDALGQRQKPGHGARRGGQRRARPARRLP